MNPSTILTWVGLTIALIVVRFLLDLELAPRSVKYFYWIPVRTVVRDKPLDLNGVWQQQWQGATTSFQDSIDRFSSARIRQLWRYCYVEFAVAGTDYVLFGQIRGDYLIGTWVNATDDLGYFGSCQLEIVDSRTLKGRWIGHSKTSREIKHGDWDWNRA